MNKTELLDEIAAKAGLKKTDTAKMFEAFINVVESTLAKGDDIRVVGFGTFSVSHRKASEGRNPKTGEAIKIGASNVPKFKAGKGLKDAVNKK
ncbi:MAG: HU family DNA-binding protein [Alphaproteobacteria bacterium]|jgi:DNA-binding protein HU-beta|nr:HU family DNA-binding protein [Alphaproteobacteria bacterium]